MELYIGGCFQGKTEYVKNRYENAVFFDETNYRALFLERQGQSRVSEENEEILVFNHFHLAIKDLFKQGFQTDEIHRKVRRILNENPKLIIISDEIGNGIVPMDKSERIYREETGRLLIEIAKRSERVERIICGMAQVIKSH